MKFLIDFPNPYNISSARTHYQFHQPQCILQAQSKSEVLTVLSAVEQAAQQGLWCVGWLRYEAAKAFDSAFCDCLHNSQDHRPLAWFAVFDANNVQPLTRHPTLTNANTHANLSDFTNVDWQMSLSRSAFNDAIKRIHQAIAAGDCYQINYTHGLDAKFNGELPAFFFALRRNQPDGYVAYIDSDYEQVLSVSPELFFDWDGKHILTRPMKGTANRSTSTQQDTLNRQNMINTPKERAENVMIVDLLRNDLSRIALPHSVQVPRLFHAEALPTVWQMTSDIQAQTRPEIGLTDIFRALFPCGSITGAPKREAMRLIHQLEIAPRDIYCGAVGLVRPSQQAGHIHATFNVPIRTVIARGNKLRCGIGSGITADAQAQAEWQEWQNKTAFLKSI